MSFNFCAHCGAALPPAKDTFAPQKCVRCGRTWYHHSKPCAGALIVQDKRVLLVRRAVEPFKGYWDIPGGFLEPGEHPRDGMLREVKEETGLEVRVIGWLGVYVDRYTYAEGDLFTLNHYYVVEPVGGTLHAADDVSEYRWFALDHLPATNQMAFEHANQVLQDLVKFAL